MICTEAEYFKMGFAIRRASTEVSRLKYHRPEVVDKMKKGLKDIRNTVKCKTPEFERLLVLCKSESRLKDRYAKMVFREVRRVRDEFGIIPEVEHRLKVYWIFDVIIAARFYRVLKHYFTGNDYKYLFTEQAQRAIIKSENNPRYEHETI